MSYNIPPAYPHSPPDWPVYLRKGETNSFFASVACCDTAAVEPRQPTNFSNTSDQHSYLQRPHTALLEFPNSSRTSQRSSAPLFLYRLCRRSQAEEIVMSAPSPAMHGMPRRYVSGMRLECKPVPWRYASSVHLKLGSTKRRYTEKVFYKMRLVPFGYFEGATADFCHEANPGARRYIATMTLQCTNVPTVRLQQPAVSVLNHEETTDA